MKYTINGEKPWKNLVLVVIVVLVTFIPTTIMATSILTIEQEGFTLNNNSNSPSSTFRAQFEFEDGAAAYEEDGYQLYDFSYYSTGGNRRQDTDGLISAELEWEMVTGGYQPPFEPYVDEQTETTTLHYDTDALTELEFYFWIQFGVDPSGNIWENTYFYHGSRILYDIGQTTKYVKNRFDKWGNPLDANMRAVTYGGVDSGSSNTPWTITYEYTDAVSPVPEPATMLLFGLGLLGVAGINRKKA